MISCSEKVIYIYLYLRNNLLNFQKSKACREHNRPVKLILIKAKPVITGWIQIRVLTNCQAISTEIGTDSLKI